MARFKSGQEALLIRDQYNGIKRMDRLEAEAFVSMFYKKGLADGIHNAETEHLNKMECSITSNKVPDYDNFINELHELLKTIPGIGPVTIKKIITTLEKRSG